MKRFNVDDVRAELGRRKRPAKWLADECDCEASTITRLLHRQTKRPSDALADRIAVVLGWSLEAVWIEEPEQ